VPGWLSLHSESLRAERYGDRILVAARFSAPVHTGHGAHPAYFTVSNGSLAGVKRPWHGVNNPPHLAPRLKKVYNYSSTPPSRPSWPVTFIPAYQNIIFSLHMKHPHCCNSEMYDSVFSNKTHSFANV
jgi:hypothetical protein